MTLKAFKNLIAAIKSPDGELISVRRDRGTEETSAPRIVWSVLSEKPRYADNKIVSRNYLIQLDYYTSEEYDEFHETVENLLTCSGISLSVSFASRWDDETEEYRYCYTLEI